MIIEKTLVIKDIPQANPCLNCESCVRLRFLELGLIPGQKIKIKEFSKDLWTISVLDENGNTSFNLGVRKEEAERILMDEDCIIGLG